MAPRPPAEVRLRLYRPSDRPLLERWDYDLHAYVGRTRPQFDAVRFPREGIRRNVRESLSLLRRAQGFILVAEVRGRPVGFVMAEVLSFSEPHDRLVRRPQLTGRIDQLFVEARARRHGVGTALLREAERRLHAAGCDNLQLGVAAGNTVARRLYREVGFEELGLHLRKGLGRPPRTWGEMRRRRALAVRKLVSLREP